MSYAMGIVSAVAQVVHPVCPTECNGADDMDLIMWYRWNSENSYPIFKEIFFVYTVVDFKVTAHSNIIL